MSIEKLVDGHAESLPNPKYVCTTDVVRINTTQSPKPGLVDIYYYSCKFPFTYQGKEYDICVFSMPEIGPFCAIESQGEDGYECPKCWKNETYRIGNCSKAERCKKVQEYKPESNGKW